MIVKNVLLNRKIRILIIFAGLICFSQTVLFSQEYFFREYGVRDGLPQSQAFIIYQDSRGFIWISTRNGLSRFDGIDFVNYHTKNGLPSNLINNIFEDSEGVLWALSLEGISRYTGSGFVFYPPGQEFSGLFFSGPPYPADKPGTCYFLFKRWGDPLHRIALFKEATYLDYSSKYQALDTFRINEMYYDSTSFELLLTDGSGRLFSWKNEILTRLPVNDVAYLNFERDRLLLNSDKTVLEYNNGKFFRHQMERNPGRPDINLNLYNSAERIRYFDGSDVTEFSIPFKSASPFIDREGVLWFSTESNISRLLSTAFSSWSETALQMRDPWAICFDENDNLWLGSLYSDLAEYDGTDFILRNNYIKDILKDFGFYKGSRLLSNGEMWLSTGSGVLIWNGKFFSRLSLIPESIQVCYIYEDPDDKQIMIGTDKGVYVITGDEVRRLDEFIPDKLGVIEGIVRDDEGFYWMSGHKGLYKYDGVNIIKAEDKILPKAYTYTVEKDRFGGIWVSSEEGLFFKGKSDVNFRHGIPQSVNQPANVVKLLDSSHLLVGRITDICLVDLDRFYANEKNYYRLFDKTDGYPGGESLDNGIVKGRDGSVWILTSENLVRFSPGKVNQNPNPPLIQITGLFYETDSLTWEPVNEKDFYYGVPSDIRLNRNEYNLKITFTGISTPNPEKVMYQYMLQNTDRKWSLPFSSREVVFRNLNAGKYSFLLKAINADGAETDEPVVLDFTIKPALIETLGFRISFILLVLVLTIILTRYLVRRTQLKKEESQKINSELLRLQMQSVLKEFDHHFTFNAISSIGSLIMKNDRKSAYLYLTRLSALLRTSLRESSSMLKPISGELDFVRNYCELQKLRFGGRFDYSIEIGEEVDLNKEIPKMTIQTFVENAIKHGFENRKEGGKVEIILIHFENYHKIILRDNGIGRSESHKIRSDSTGYGIKTVNRVIDIMNRNNQLKASLEISDLTSDGVSSGTEVVIIIPDVYNFRIEGLFSNMDDTQNSD